MDKLKTMEYKIEKLEGQIKRNKQVYVVIGTYEGKGEDRICFKGTKIQCENYIFDEMKIKEREARQRISAATKK